MCFPADVQRHNSEREVEYDRRAEKQGGAERIFARTLESIRDRPARATIITHVVQNR